MIPTQNKVLTLVLLLLISHSLFATDKKYILLPPTQTYSGYSDRIITSDNGHYIATLDLSDTIDKLNIKLLDFKTQAVLQNWDLSTLNMNFNLLAHNYFFKKNKIYLSDKKNIIVLDAEDGGVRSFLIPEDQFILDQYIIGFEDLDDEFVLVHTMDVEYKKANFYKFSTFDNSFSKINNSVINSEYTNYHAYSADQNILGYLNNDATTYIFNDYKSNKTIELPFEMVSYNAKFLKGTAILYNCIYKLYDKKDIPPLEKLVCSAFDLAQEKTIYSFETIITDTNKKEFHMDLKRGSIYVYDGLYQYTLDLQLNVIKKDYQPGFDLSFNLNETEFLFANYKNRNSMSQMMTSSQEGNNHDLENVLDTDDSFIKYNICYSPLYKMLAFSSIKGKMYVYKQE